MILIPFKSFHLVEMRDYGGQAWMEAFLNDPSTDALAYETAGPCWTGTAGGDVLGAAGLVRRHDHCAVAWAILSSKAPAHFLSIHKAVSLFLSDQPFARIEAHIDCAFPAAARWVQKLGFTCEAERMPHFLPDGRDASLWAKIKV